MEHEELTSKISRMGFWISRISSPLARRWAYINFGKTKVHVKRKARIWDTTSVADQQDPIILSILSSCHPVYICFGLRRNRVGV